MLTNAPVSVSMPAVDLARARKFYGETLGLKVREGPMDDAAIFEAGGGTFLFLYQREATKADHTVAGFTVESVEASVTELTERGVVFEQYDMGPIKTDERGVALFGDDKVAWFKDSEGNILSLNEVSMAA